MCDNFETILRMQLLPDFAERYILFCREKQRFPNIAGFFRFCGAAADETERLKRDFPDSYSALCLIFEDEALNSKLSASILSVYLKKRLGYEDETEKKTTCDTGQLRLVFEHDIITDGE